MFVCFLNIRRRKKNINKTNNFNFKDKILYLNAQKKKTNKQKKEEKKFLIFH